MGKRFEASSGILALVALAAFYGVTAVLARYLAVGNGLFEQWYMRYGIAFIVALFVFRKHLSFKKFLHLPKKEWSVLLLRALTGGVAAVGLYTLAAQNAKIGPVAFMQALPTLTILAVVLMNEKLTLKKGLLVLLSFIGAAVIVIDNPRDIFSFNIGEIYSLISGILFSLMFITRKWHAKILNNQEITTAILGICFIANYVLSIVLYNHFVPSTDHWTPLFVAVLVFAGIAAVANVFLLNYGFEKVSGVVAGNILNLEQVFGPMFGYLFYKELLSEREIMGGLIIVIAAFLMNMLNKKDGAIVGTPE